MQLAAALLHAANGTCLGELCSVTKLAHMASHALNVSTVIAHLSRCLPSPLPTALAYCTANMQMVSSFAELALQPQQRQNYWPFMGHIGK